jgi:hypothetical protein
VIPAPVTGTGSRVPSAEACKSSGLGRWSVLPLRWFWASLFGTDAAASETFPDEAGCRACSIFFTRHSMRRLLSSHNSALQISKISPARMPSSRTCWASTGGTNMTRSPSSAYITCGTLPPIWTTMASQDSAEMSRKSNRKKNWNLRTICRNPQAGHDEKFMRLRAVPGQSLECSGGPGQHLAL